AIESRMPTSLVQVDMRAVADHDLVAAAAVRLNGEGVAHRAGGDEESSFFANLLGGQLLQPVHRWVLTINVVAYLGVIHRLTHGGRWLGYGVAAQINNRPGGKRADAGLVTTGHGLISSCRCYAT